MLRFDPFSDMDAWTRGMMTGSAAGTARTPRFMPLDLYKVEDHYLLGDGSLLERLEQMT